MSEQKQYTLQEKIQFYRNEIVEATIYLSKCTRRLSQLLSQEARQMTKQMLDEYHMKNSPDVTPEIIENNRKNGIL